MIKAILKWFIVLTVLIIGGCCSAVTKHKITNAADYSLLEHNTIALVNQEDNITLQVKCGGVWVSRDAILTAAHCVETKEMSDLSQLIGRQFFRQFFHQLTAKGDEALFITRNDWLEYDEQKGKGRLAEVIYFDTDADLAVLKVKGRLPKHDIAYLSNEQIHPGQNLHIIGHKEGYWWSYSKGYVSQIRTQHGPTEESVKVIQVDGTVWLGNSGGAAFDESGDIVGICSYIDKRAPGLSFFIHRDVIRLALIKAGVIHAGHE